VLEHWSSVTVCGTILCSYCVAFADNRYRFGETSWILGWTERDPLLHMLFWTNGLLMFHLTDIIIKSIRHPSFPVTTFPSCLDLAIVLYTASRTVVSTSPRIGARLRSHSTFGSVDQASTRQLYILPRI
jgi:hypothetical protein